MRIILSILLFISSTLVFANTLYPLNNPRQEAQFTHLLKNLRCLVCQNQDLADSNATLAKDLRQKVYHLVREGHSDDEINNYLTARYGDFILFKPPVKTLTIMLWLGPLAFLLMGLIVFWKNCFGIRVNE